MAGWHDVAALADLEAQAGSGMAVRAGEISLTLFLDGDRVHAVQSACPHRGGDLAGGLVHAGCVVCPLHAWQFRLQDGANVDGGPGLDTYPVRVEGGRILVQA